MAGFKRIDRVSEMVQRELSWILQNEIRDPRLSFCTVTHVELSPDLRYAKVKISSVDESTNELLPALRKASKFLRRQVGHRLELKHVPELFFRVDDTVDRLMEIDQMLAGLRDSDC